MPAWHSRPIKFRLCRCVGSHSGWHRGFTAEKQSEPNPDPDLGTSSYTRTCEDGEDVGQRQRAAQRRDGPRGQLVGGFRLGGADGDARQAGAGQML